MAFFKSGPCDLFYFKLNKLLICCFLSPGNFLSHNHCYYNSLILLSILSFTAHALKVGELRPAPRPAPSPLTSARSRRHVAECWHVIFAPDETRFAWLCGTSRVLIVPWNRFKNCL